MTRKHKFRTFIKEDNIMFTQKENDSDYFMISNGDEFVVIYDNGFEKIYLKDEEYVTMEFTGRVDKTEVDIFEGDIVILSWRVGVDSKPTEVRYNSDKCEYQVALTSRNGKLTWYGFGICDSMKVIGNIYQNKLQDYI